jgi:hypothetical protein
VFAAGGWRSPARLVGAFEEVAPNEPLLYEDSNGSLAIAINGGNAAEQLGIKRGARVTVLGEPLPGGEPPRGVVATGDAAAAPAVSQSPAAAHGAAAAPPTAPQQPVASPPEPAAPPVPPAQPEPPAPPA